MITVALFASIGMKTVAESFWAGHHDIEMINRNIDTLSNRIKTKKSENFRFKRKHFNFKIRYCSSKQPSERTATTINPS